jgi:hypothetical protein
MIKKKLMSENNQFEIVMQQKMDGFMVEPAPSDWQAIYDRLHPRNKRRIIWWWFPLIAALGAGFFWIYQPTTTGGLTDNITAKSVLTSDSKDVSSPDKKQSAGSSIPNPQKENNAVQSESAPLAITDNNRSDSENQPSDNSKTNITKNNRSVSSVFADNTTKRTTRKNTTYQSVQKENKAVVTRSSKGAMESRKQTATTAAPVKTTLTEMKKAPSDPNRNATTAPIENAAVDQNKNTTTDPDKNSLVDQNKITTTGPDQTAPVDPNKNTTTGPDKDAVQTGKTSSIPVKTKANRWQWAGYIGAGPNYPSDPLSIGANALAASAPDYNSGSSITYTTNSRESGWHLAGGMMAEKKMGNNWKFSAGLGINSSTWTTKSEKFKDSVFSGAFSSTVKVSSEQHKNQLWMAEIPLQFSNRISGKKAGTLWWTIGMNNQFRLRLSQNTSKDSTSRTLSSDSRTLTSAARFYQPQFRAGLMYDHSGKMHWQLQPLFQYSMTGVYTKDIADNTVMANLQLQYRMFLQGKKESKKVNK